IDILVNNSGRSQRGLIINTEFKVDQELFELNVLGTISLTKVVLPHMIERHAGHIVVVSSLTGKLGVPTSGTYSATKHALQGYFYSLRTEVYDNGIDVSIVCPGPVKSAIVENSVSEKFGKSAKDTPYGKEDMSRRMETDQFVKYMAIAMVNKLDECWISPQPGLWVVYASQYIPSIFTWLYKRYGLRHMKKLRHNEGKVPDMSWHENVS
ncbi:dehydrogenase reductase SDR family member 7-like, partial [Paramuricea clavata]